MKDENEIKVDKGRGGRKPSTSITRTPVEASLRRQTVLIVSADSDQSRLMAGCLNNAGYEAWMTDRGQSALEMIGNEKPNLVILDWKLPDFSLREILRVIRAGKRTASLPIIVMGKEMQEGDILINLEAGADICLAETFYPKVFVARVRSLLRRIGN